jgi:hypothetical protein
VPRKRSPPAVNGANAGGNEPVRFTLTENQGLDEHGVAQLSQEINCSTHAPVGDITPVRGRLTHHRERYDFVWRTDRAWENTCRQLILRIADVTDPVAWFQFH